VTTPSNQSVGLTREQERTGNVPQWTTSGWAAPAPTQTRPPNVPQMNEHFGYSRNEYRYGGGAQWTSSGWAAGKTSLQIQAHIIATFTRDVCAISPPIDIFGHQMIMTRRLHDAFKYNSHNILSDSPDIDALVALIISNPMLTTENAQRIIDEVMHQLNIRPELRWPIEQGVWNVLNPPRPLREIVSTEIQRVSSTIGDAWRRHLENERERIALMDQTYMPDGRHPLANASDALINLFHSTSFNVELGVGFAGGIKLGVVEVEAGFTNSAVVTINSSGITVEEEVVVAGADFKILKILGAGAGWDNIADDPRFSTSAELGDASLDLDNFEVVIGVRKYLGIGGEVNITIDFADFIRRMEGR